MTPASRKRHSKAPEVIILARYSGDRSSEFWDAINATKDRTLYDFACALQSVEARVLAVLNTSKPRKTRPYMRAADGRTR